MSYLGFGEKYLGQLESEMNGVKDLSLRAITRVMAELGNPQDLLSCVHVAGTNGKGSVSAAVSAILGASGAKVGLTISPHLTSINERIVIGGNPIASELLDAVVWEVAQAAERVKVKLTFFEVITATAFLAFSQLRLDWAVLEVGLGGRLDATNIIKKPEAAAIVTIDFDHEHILGNTLAKIAAEKAGIVKPGTKLVVGSMAPEASEVIARMSREKEASFFQFNRDFGFKQSAESLSEYNFWSDTGCEFSYKPSLMGLHQAHNMAVAIQVAQILGLSVESCQQGVAKVFWPGRLEQIRVGEISLLLDCAHNPAGIRQLIQFIGSRKSYAPHVIFGALNTKDWKQMVQLLAPVVAGWSIAKPDSDRALDCQELESYLSSIGISAKRCEINYQLLAGQILRGDYGQEVLICGSMYLLGKLRPYLVKNPQPIWK